MRALGIFLTVFIFSTAVAENLTIVAASDLRLVMPEIIAQYQAQRPKDNFKIIYGSSGKLTTQIINGAPFDVFFSADSSFPERLYKEGFSATKPEVYAIGRIVLWSRKMDASALTLEDLPNETQIRRFAIANPHHAPYGMRAEEALRHAGVWEAMQPKLVHGENIAQTMQMIESEAAEAGIIALALVFSPSAASHGYYLIPQEYHAPLLQTFIITKRAENNPAAKRFVAFLNSPDARASLEKYGFVLPEPAP
jgi:molybdate transport system substrate-binding protein